MTHSDSLSSWMVPSLEAHMEKDLTINIGLLGKLCSTTETSSSRVLRQTTWKRRCTECLFLISSFTEVVWSSLYDHKKMSLNIEWHLCYFYDLENSHSWSDTCLQIGVSQIKVANRMVKWALANKILFFYIIFLVASGIARCWKQLGRQIS